MRQIARNNRRGAEAQARLQRILDVAHQLFIRNGYQHTSLDTIVRQAGGSKATLRKYFGNKAGLMAAVIDRRAAQRLAEVQSAIADAPEPATALRRLARHLLRFYLEPDALDVYRSVVAEASRNPNLAQGFYHGAHLRIVESLAQLLRHWQAKGSIQSADLSGDADRFILMLRSGPHHRGLLGVQKTFSDAELDAHVERTVQLFLGGISVPSKR